MAEVADRGVAPSRVVEGFDVLKDRRGKLRSSLPASGVQQLELQDAEEALGHGVVEGITDRTHRAKDAGGTQPSPESPGGVLASRRRRASPWRPRALCLSRLYYSIIRYIMIGES